MVGDQRSLVEEPRRSDVDIFGEGGRGGGGGGGCRQTETLYNCTARGAFAVQRVPPPKPCH